MTNEINKNFFDSKNVLFQKMSILVYISKRAVGGKFKEWNLYVEEALNDIQRFFNLIGGKVNLFTI